MSNPTYSRRPSEARAEDALSELALDVRWSWNHSTDKLWQKLDAELWELTHNPWVILQTVSQAKLDSVSSDPEFQATLQELAEEHRAVRQEERWFQRAHSNTSVKSIAYFSMEYMLSEALPFIPAAGKHRGRSTESGAAIFGVPVIAVGLLYQQGYFRQEFDHNGGSRSRSTRSTIPVSCRFARCAMMPGTGCGSSWIFRAFACGFAPGKCRWGAIVCCCSIPTTRPTSRNIAASPAN